MYLNDQLLFDLPNLEVFKDNKIKYYKTTQASRKELIFEYNDEDHVISKRDFSRNLEFGLVLNYEEYKSSLSDAFLNQELDIYQLDRKISNYCY